MAVEQIDDKVLVRQYLKGCNKSFETLLQRHKNKIYQNVYFMVRDRDLAEDVFQETFVKVINTLQAGRYNEEGKFYPWVMRIAHNLVIDHFRKEKKMRKVRGDDEFNIFDVLVLEDKNVETDIVNAQILGDVKQLLEYLPEDQKRVVKMRIYQDLSFKDIADITGVSINTALGRMRYALINLRRIMEEKNVSLTID